MFKRTGSDDFPNKLKLLVSGTPKSGKTTLLGTFPNVVIADTEPHANNLQSVAHLNLPYVTVNGLDDLYQLRMVLGDETLRAQAAASLGLPQIDTVAIDTMDTLQKIMKRERLREQRQTQFQRDDWGWLKEEMARIIESFTSLPLHVIFTVHLKTKELGKGDDTRTVVLPGLEGAIADEIAGMVGYSLLSFRKAEVAPDGSAFTKYWLRAEGDETYEYLGNRAAGRLPDVIEPEFKSIYDAAMAGRPTQPSAAPVQMPQIQTTGQTAAQSAPAAPTQTQAPDQNPVQPAAPAPAADAEPVNAAALGHVKKVYDAVGLAFPEDLIKALTLGEARTLVRMWQAVQHDAIEGKAQEGTTPVSNMVAYLTDMGQVGSPSTAPAGELPTIHPKVDGTIDQVMAYADDLAKVQEAYDLETSKDKPRSSLVEALLKKGAKVQTPIQNEPPAATEPPLTSEAPAVDEVPTEEQAIGTAEAVLGATVISQELNADSKCEECTGPLDDLDLAQLGMSRFNKVFCVSCYILETKKPR